MADGEPRGAGYIFYNFQLTPNQQQFYEPEIEAEPEVDNGWRWWNPFSWDNNNEEVAARRQENIDAVYSEWERQLAVEEGKTENQRQIEAESGWNPFSWVMDAIAQGQNMRSADYNPLIPSAAGGYNSEEAARRRELDERSRAIVSRQFDDRADVVGTPRALAEVAAPAAIMAGARVPVGRGFGMLPQAVQTSRLGSYFAPMTGPVTGKLQWLYSRGIPAMTAAGAVSNEVPGSVPTGVADDIVGNVAGGIVGSTIMRRWPGAVGATAGLIGGFGAGIGGAIAVGNEVDQQRRNRIREYAFRDQERLNYTYNRNPEMFPEFVPVDRAR